MAERALRIVKIPMERLSPKHTEWIFFCINECKFQWYDYIQEVIHKYCLFKKSCESSWINLLFFAIDSLHQDFLCLED